jgi:hypothetical protein
MIPHRYLVVAAAVMLALAVGCDSGSRSGVKGSVNYDSQSVDKGGIAFIPEGDANDKPRVRATGQIRDGKYELDGQHGPNPGKYRVEITWHKKTGQKVPGEGGVLKDETQQVLPAKYNTESKTTVDVLPGRNTFDFNLEK